MKKFLMTMVAFFGVLAIVACGKKDEVKPVITVPAAAVTIYKGDVFEPLKNVVAMDDVDGDLTANITVTGSVDSTKEGSYTLVYTVKDKAGNEGTKEVIVTVVARPQGIGLVNTEFAEWDAERNLPVGWNSWVNTSQDVAAEFLHEDGKAVVNITAQSIVKDNNWWDVQFKANTVTFPAFASYTLRIWAYAEHPRYMMVNLQGGGMPKKAIDAKLVELGTTVPTEPIEIDFFSSLDAKNAELQFGLGTFHKVADVPENMRVVLGKVYFVKVEVVEGPELENQAPTLQGKDIIIDIGGSVLIKQGIKVNDDRDTLTLDDVTATPVGNALDVNKAGVYEYKYTVKDKDNLEAELTRKIIVGSFVVPTMDKWTSWAKGDAEPAAAQTVTVSEDGKTAEIDVTGVGPSDWHNQFKLTGMMGTKGTYKISFKAKASVARTIEFALEQDFGAGTKKFWNRLDLTTEFQTFEYEITLNNDATGSGAFQFWFGNALNRKITVDGVVTEPFAGGTYVPAVITITDFVITKV
ncbi:MAG: immunoglobulin-like domain-containing protein [Acholeplasmatales bacterium]